MRRILVLLVLCGMASGCTSLAPHLQAPDLKVVGLSFLGGDSRHQQLRLRVQVTNPANGRSITVRINDRGPFGPAHALGVEFDLARGAARALGLTQTNWVCADY